MTARPARLLPAVLAVAAAPIGLWASLAPRSFFDGFPGGGRHRVAPDGPFDEHLVRDVGFLHLALLVAGSTAPGAAPSR